MIARQNGERLGGALLVQLAGLLQPAAQPKHRFFIEDGDRVAPLALEHHEAHRIGTEIDDSAAARRISESWLSHAPRFAAWKAELARCCHPGTEPGGFVAQPAEALFSIVQTLLIAFQHEAQVGHPDRQFRYGKPPFA